MIDGKGEMLYFPLSLSEKNRPLSVAQLQIMLFCKRRWLHLQSEILPKGSFAACAALLLQFSIGLFSLQFRCKSSWAAYTARLRQKAAVTIVYNLKWLPYKTEQRTVVRSFSGK